MARRHTFIQIVDQHIGTVISDLRVVNGLSRLELANKIGVTHQQLHKYEKGSNRISAGRLALIAKALGKPVEFFYAGLDASKEIGEAPSKRQRMCLEVSRNFMKIQNPAHQYAVNTLIKSLIKEEAA